MFHCSQKKRNTFYETSCSQTLIEMFTKTVLSKPLPLLLRHSRASVELLFWSRVFMASVCGTGQCVQCLRGQAPEDTVHSLHQQTTREDQQHG